MKTTLEHTYHPAVEAVVETTGIDKGRIKDPEAAANIALHVADMKDEVSSERFDELIDDWVARNIAIVAVRMSAESSIHAPHDRLVALRDLRKKEGLVTEAVSESIKARQSYDEFVRLSMSAKQAA